jgi:hypothetical protein
MVWGFDCININLAEVDQLNDDECLFHGTSVSLAELESHAWRHLKVLFNG